jgi:hypothetical protein
MDTGHLDVWEVVLPDWDEVACAEQDAGSLMDRVGEQKFAEGTPGCGVFGLDCRIAVQHGLGDQTQKGQHQLVQCGYCGVDEDRRPLRVDTCGQVVQHSAVHVVTDFADGVAVGD